MWTKQYNSICSLDSKLLGSNIFTMVFTCLENTSLYNRNIIWKSHYWRCHWIGHLSQLRQDGLEIITVSQLQRSFFLLQYRPMIWSHTLALASFPNSSPFYVALLLQRDERNSSPCETVSEYVLCACVNECLKPEAHLVWVSGSAGDLVLHLPDAGCQTCLHLVQLPLRAGYHLGVADWL